MSSLKMLGLSAGISDLTTVRWELAGYLLLAWVIVYCALWKGVKSIGKVTTDNTNIALLSEIIPPCSGTRSLCT